jgi:hypothetical protein
MAVFPAPVHVNRRYQGKGTFPDQILLGTRFGDYAPFDQG